MKEVYVRALLEQGPPSLASLTTQGLELSLLLPSPLNNLFSEVQLALKHGEVTKAHSTLKQIELSHGSDLCADRFRQVRQLAFDIELFAYSG